MNILLFSPIYPGPGVGENFTKVVHYFAKEWVKMGVNVQVVSIPSYFPRFMYWVPKKIKAFVSNKLGFAFPEYRNDSVDSYNIEGVNVLRTPLFKRFPGKLIQEKYLKKAKELISLHFLKIGFKPDVIVGHWSDPTLFFVDAFKRECNCPSLVVIHGSAIRHYLKYIDSVDCWGCRLNTNILIGNSHDEIKPYFRCYSGIPTLFLKQIPNRDFNTVSNYIYVGVLINRKHPDKVIDAVSKVHNDSGFNLVLLGDGGMLNNLRKKVLKMRYEDKIILPGRVSQDEIIRNLDKAEVFIMISEAEVFGLVYIEAMARGCIVVASEGEGMEGIIINGENGFLCKAGDTENLIEVINKIRSLTPENRRQISLNAISTAHALTNENVAREYLSEIIKLKNS